MSIIIALFIAFSLVFAFIKIIKNPFIGLLLMTAVNSIEGVLKMPSGLTLGRMVGILSVVGWIIYLNRYPLALKRFQDSSLLRVIWAFPLVCFIGVIYSSINYVEGFSSVWQVSLLAIFAIMIENLVDTKKKIYQLVLFFLLSSVVAAIFPTAYYFNIDIYSPLGLYPEDAVIGGRTSGLTNNANALGVASSTGIYSLLILSTVSRKTKAMILMVVFGFIILTALVLSGSRTHFINVIIFLSLFGFFRLFGPKKNRVFAVFIIPALFLFVLMAYQMAPENLQERLIFFGDKIENSTLKRQAFAENQRKYAFTIIRDNLFFGYGLRGFEKLSSNGYAAHDSISSLLGETGLLGVASFMWLSLSCWRWLYNAINLAMRKDIEIYYFIHGFISSYIAMFIAGFGGYVIFYNRWFWLTVGISAVIAQWSKSMIVAVPPIKEISSNQGQKYLRIK